MCNITAIRKIIVKTLVLKMVVVIVTITVIKWLIHIV